MQLYKNKQKIRATVVSPQNPDPQPIRTLFPLIPSDCLILWMDDSWRVVVEEQRVKESTESN